MERLDLEQFLNKYNDPQIALMEAHKALFNEAGYGAVLECHGIPIPIKKPFLLRNTPGPDQIAMGSEQSDKRVNGLNLRLDPLTRWRQDDYIYSIAGQSDRSDLRGFTLDQPRIDCAKNPAAIGLHVSGYYHCSIIHPVIRNVKRIGIVSSKYARDIGIGIAKIDNANHGLEITHPDISDDFNSIAPSIGIYLEDGDAVVSGGWVSFTQIGVKSVRGGMNIKNTHFSIGNQGNALYPGCMKHAIWCSAPRSVSLENLECDGSGVMFTNTEPHLWNASDHFDRFRQINIRGGKFGLGEPPHLGDGVITFMTNMPDTRIDGLNIDPEWINFTGPPSPPVVFKNDGKLGEWNQDLFSNMSLNLPDSHGRNIYTSKLTIGAAPSKPTITSGISLPTSPEPNGSIYLRNNQSGNAYLRQNGMWVPLGKNF